MNDSIERVLITEEEIQTAVRRMADDISRDYEGKNLVLLGILKGSVVFMGDLMKRLSIPVQIDFMKVSSYGSGTTSKGLVDIILDIRRKDLGNCDILIIEDIIDSGKTLSYLAKYLKEKGARSVRTCTMLDKPSRREVEFQPDYSGFEIPDEFVIGYGLDYDEKFRALPFVGILKREIYEK
ncbi:MAG: hypoxanthine phosphoribosyltransferase [Clostridia bacterium]|nr:hypoxanthine phosphoribosyltransferase [Clostridia bacterium]